MSIKVNDNFFLRAPKPLDDRIGEFSGGVWNYPSSVAAFLANTAITPYRYPSLTVTFMEGGIQKEYWFVGGVADADFKLKLTSVPTPDNLQEVTTGVGNNATSNVIIIDGEDNADVNRPGMTLSFDGVGGIIRNQYGFGEYNGDIAFTSIGTQIRGSAVNLDVNSSTLILGDESGLVAGATFNKRVSIQNSTLDNEAITQGQVNTSLNLKANISGQIFTGNISAPNLSGTNTGDQDLAPYQLRSEKGQPNGYAGLDSGAKILLANLPDSILGQVEYIGTWNASTNTPTLISPPASTTKGHYYIATVAGTQFGISFQVGDWIISNGVEWDKVDNTDAVMTVFGRIGNILANASDYSAFYPLLSGSYINPTWIESLPYSKITGTPDLSVYELLANKQNSLAVDGSGIKYPTVDAVNFAFGIDESLIAYVDVAGDNSTAIVGNSRKPYQTIEAAIDALPSDQMVMIKLGLGNFNSPPKIKLRDDIVYMGSGKPITDSTISILSESDQPVISSPTKLIKGTILKGPMMHINKRNVKILNLGVDVGSEWCTNFNGGVSAEGINFAQYYDPEGGQSGADGTHPLQTDSPPLFGVEIDSVTILVQNSTAPVHCLLVENLVTPKANNISTYYGLYGFVSKSFGGNFSNIDAHGHGMAGITLKANDYAYNLSTNLVNAYITSIGAYDGGGILLQGEEGKTSSFLNLSNINLYFTKNGIFNISSVTGLSLNGASMFNIQGNGVEFSGAISYTYLNNVQIRNVGNIGFLYNTTGIGVYNTITNSLVSNAAKGFDLNGSTDNNIVIHNLQSMGNVNAFTFGVNILGTSLYYNSGSYVGSLTPVTTVPSDKIAQINSDGNIGFSTLSIEDIPIDADLVHKAGVETITGTKTFSSDVNIKRLTGNPSLIIENGSGGSFPIIQFIDNRVSGVNWNVESGRTLGNFELLAGGVGTVFSVTPSGNISFTGKGTAGAAPIAANDLLRYTDLGTGWAQYTDNVYTSGSPLVINAGATSIITNNAATTLASQLPIGVTSFYNSGTSKITPQNDGDSYLINVRFTAVSSSTSGLADIAIDIGGAMNIIVQETISLRKGIGQSQRVNIEFDVFSGSTFVANGGLIKLNSIDGNTSIYDISYKVTRTHKAK